MNLSPNEYVFIAALAFLLLVVLGVGKVKFFRTFKALDSEVENEARSKGAVRKSEATAPWSATKPSVTPSEASPEPSESYVPPVMSFDKQPPRMTFPSDAAAGIKDYWYAMGVNDGRADFKAKNDELERKYDDLEFRYGQMESERNSFRATAERLARDLSEAQAEVRRLRGAVRNG